MRDKKILEGNKLIAEFMQIPSTTDVRGTRWHLKDTVLEFNGAPDPWGTSFDASWDWLMPVVKNISSRIDLDDGIFNRETIDMFDHYVVKLSIVSPIDEVYDGVLRFIKWYNKTEK